MIEIFANVTTANPTLGAVVSTAPSAGTVETWTFATISWGTGLKQVPAATTNERIRASVDNEIVYVSNVNSGANTASVTRGALGSTPATHANGASVTFQKILHELFPANLDRLYVKVGDYFGNKVITGFGATTSNQTVNIQPGVATGGGFRGILAETQTISGLSFSTNYWIQFNAQTGNVSAVQASSGANQVPSSTNVNLYYAAVAASPGAVTLTDLRGVGIPSVGLNSIASFTTVNNIEPPNAAPTWSAASGSNMVDAGNHAWAYTWVNANGESVPSPLSTSTTTIASGTQSVTVTIPAFPSGVVAARIYRTKTAGSYAATSILSLYHVGTIPSGTTLVDQLPDANMIIAASLFIDTFSNTQTAGHILNSGRNIPTISAGTRSSGFFSADSTDTRGRITVNSSNPSPLANNTLLTVTFGTAFLNTPHIILHETTLAADSPPSTSAGNMMYVFSPSTTGFQLRNGSGLSPSVSYSLDYWVIG